MQIMKAPAQKEITRAAKALINGDLVAFPTETVYGLGADATSADAVRRIYQAKNRPTDHPIIVHISSIKNLEKWAVHIPDYALRLAESFWPGPMTLILNRSDIAKDFITGGQNMVGIRIPSHSIAQALISEFESLGGLGIAAPSANRFGAVSPTNAKAVYEEIGDMLTSRDIILDGGNSSIGIESTIVDCTFKSPLVLRPGSITDEMIEDVTQYSLNKSSHHSKIKTSGLLKTHYAPNAKVVLGNHAEPGDGFIALSSVQTPTGAIRLAAPNDLIEYARDLYEALRSADRSNMRNVFIVVPDGVGLALAIKDRVEKASQE